MSTVQGVLADPVGQCISARESSFSSLAYRGTRVIGTDTLCLSLSCREYRVMAKRASRVPRIILDTHHSRRPSVDFLSQLESALSAV
jgi:hypothetical protein